jgi:flagellar assembly factor FliW
MHTASGARSPGAVVGPGQGSGQRTLAQVTEGEPVEADVPVITFTRPLPGFPDLDAFLLVWLDPDGVEQESSAEEDTEVDAGAESVLYELRSVQRPEIRFLVAVPTVFFPDYTVDLDQDTCADLGLEDADDALVLVILTVGADPEPTTANLVAPVVINARTRAAAQVILSGTDWPVRATVV